MAGNNINSFIEDFIKRGVLKTKAVIDAFGKVDRTDFLPEDLKEQAYINEPLSIGTGQTISQPETVAFMLELLQPRKNQKIWDIGMGSGWQTSLLAEIVGPKGRVYAMERIGEVFDFGKQNIKKRGYRNIKLILRDATKGVGKKILFDRIIATASGEIVPQVWFDYLKVNGRMVLPIRESIWLYVKKGANKFYKKEYKGFAFVPLISE